MSRGSVTRRSVADGSASRADRLGQGESSFVERSANDGRMDGSGGAGERLEMREGSDSAAGNHGMPRRFGQSRGVLQVRSHLRAVALDVGVEKRAQG